MLAGKTYDLDFHMCMNCRAQFIGVENFASHIKVCHPPTVSYPQAYRDIPRLRPLRSPSPHTPPSSPTPTSTTSDEDTDIAFIESDFWRFHELYGDDDCDTDGSLSETNELDGEREVEGMGETEGRDVGEGEGGEVGEREDGGKGEGERVGGRKGEEGDRKNEGLGPSLIPVSVKERVFYSGDSSDRPSTSSSGQDPNDGAIPLERDSLSVDCEHNYATYTVQERGDRVSIDVSNRDPKERKMDLEVDAGLSVEDLSQASILVVIGARTSPPGEASGSAPTRHPNVAQVSAEKGATANHILLNAPSTSRDATDSRFLYTTQWILSKSQQLPVAQIMLLVTDKKDLTSESKDTREVTWKINASNMETQSGCNIKSSVTTDGRVRSDVSKEGDRTPSDVMSGGGDGQGKTSHQGSPTFGRKAVANGEMGLNEKGKEHEHFTYNELDELDQIQIPDHERNKGVVDGQTKGQALLVNTASGSRNELSILEGRRRFVVEGGDDDSQGQKEVSRDDFVDGGEGIAARACAALREEKAKESTPLLVDVSETLHEKSQGMTCTQTAESRTCLPEGVSGLPGGGIYAKMDDAIKRGPRDKRKYELTSAIGRNFTALLEKKIKCEGGDYGQTSVYNFEKPSGQEGPLIDDVSDVSGREGQGTIFVKIEDAIKKDATDRQMEEPTSLACREGLGMIFDEMEDAIKEEVTDGQMEEPTSLAGGEGLGMIFKSRKACTLKGSGETVRSDVSYRVRFWEGTGAVRKGRPFRHKMTGSRRYVRKFLLVKCVNPSNSAPDGSDGFHPVIESIRSLAGEQSDSSVSDNIQITAKGTEEREGSPKAIDGSSGSALEHPVFEEDRDGRVTFLGSVESTEARINSTKRRLPTAAVCSDNNSVEMLAKLSLRTVLREMAPTTKVKKTMASRHASCSSAHLQEELNRLVEWLGTEEDVSSCRESQHASWSGEGAGDSSTTSSDNTLNAGSAPLQEELSHMVKWLKSSERASSCGESHVLFDGNPSDVGASGCEDKDKPLAKKYENDSSCRKYLASEFSDEVGYVGIAAPDGGLNRTNGIVQVVSSLVENRKSVSDDDTCDGGTVASEGQTACTTMQSKQVSSCIESLSETKPASNENMFDAGTTSGGKIARTTLLSKHTSSCTESPQDTIACPTMQSHQVNSCLESLNERQFLSNVNTLDACTTSPLGNLTCKTNASRLVSSHIESLNENPPTSIGAMFDAEDKIACSTMLSGQIDSCLESLNESLFLSNVNTLDAGTTSPLGNLACITNASHLVSNHIESLDERQSASIRATFDAGKTSEDEIACPRMPSEQVNSCAESLNKSLFSSENNMIDRGTSSSQCHLTCATSASHHVPSHVQKLPETSSASDFQTCTVVNSNCSDNPTSLVGISPQRVKSFGENLSERSFTSCTNTKTSSPIFVNSEACSNSSSKCVHEPNLRRKRRITPDEIPASASPCSVIPLSVDLGYRCDSAEFLRQHRTSQSLPKDAEHVDKTKSIDPSASNDITFDAGTTSPQGILTCATNASHHASSNLEKQSKISLAYHTCDVVTTAHSDNLTSVIGISSQHAPTSEENFCVNSFISNTSTEISSILVNSETQCNLSFKHVPEPNLESKRKITLDKRPVSANLSINLGYKCDSIEFLRQHHTSRSLPKDAKTAFEDKTFSCDSKDEGVNSESEPPTSSVAVEERETNNLRIFSLDIMDNINLLRLALRKPFNSSIKPKSLLTNDSKKDSSSMVRRDYPKRNSRRRR